MKVFYSDVLEIIPALDGRGKEIVEQFLMDKHKIAGFTILLIDECPYLNGFKKTKLLKDRSSLTGNAGSWEVQWKILKFNVDEELETAVAILK